MQKEACTNQDKERPENIPASPRQIDSRTLFGDERTLTIQHGKDLYTLRITRAEKLLLTK